VNELLDIKGGMNSLGQR